MVKAAIIKRRWICVVCVACLFCLVAVGGWAWRAWRFERRGIERPGRAGIEGRPGINVELTQYDADELEHALSDVASLGFYWLRQRFPWQAIEPQPGVYDWARWDTVVNAVQRHNLGLIAVLDTPPEWSRRRSEYPLPCLPPWDQDLYARFVSAFAQRYGESIDYYQVWDEPNLSRAWGGGHVAPCGYAVLLEAAYPAVHSADPTAWVLGGGLAPTQAPGPDNLNDLTYLQQLYATGGGAYFDILAVKAYGFWSGPDDRRVAPDVLDFSRAIALRELLRARGDGGKPIWAVEWGWNVLSADWKGDPPPWGGDEFSVQRSRILEAMARAGAEWPWMGVMCWAEYQPHLPPADPRWGFALRHGDGSPAPLYDVFRVDEDVRLSATSGSRDLFGPWVLAIILLLIVGMAFVGWLCGCGVVLRQWWRWWVSLPPFHHACALLVLAVLYVFTPWPEWILLELALAAILFYAHPRWALACALFSVPFFYASKPIGGLQIPPSETFLALALVVTVCRRVRAKQWTVLRRQWSVLDAVWVLWVIVGARSLFVAPDPASAWREWRLCLLDPALLYFLLRSKKKTYKTASDYWPLLAWILSGVVVALVGVGQWGAGTLVRAGNVGRVTSVYYSPNHLALYLERIWPLALALALCGGLKRRWRLVAWGTVAVLGVALYLTYSRGAWLLGIPIALAAVGWSHRRRLRWWMIVGGGVVLLLAITNVFYGRLAPVTELLGEVRIPVWQSTLKMIADHPWLGVGPDGFRFVYPRYMRVEAWTEPLLDHPHNVWLDAGVRLGLPGLVVFVVLVFCCLYTAVRVAQDASDLQKAVAIGCLAGLLAALAHGVVDSGYFLVDLAWSLALVAGSLTLSPPVRRKSIGDKEIACAISGRHKHLMGGLARYASLRRVSPRGADGGACFSAPDFLSDSWLRCLERSPRN